MDKKELHRIVSDAVKSAAKIGAEAALQTFKQENEKARLDFGRKKLRNTKLLLKNFRMFKAHAECSLSELKDIDEDVYLVIESMMTNSFDDEIYVESIARSSARTQIIITHIEEMIRIYEAYCYKSGKPEDMRRYRIIYARYIKDGTAPTISELAESEMIDERTVYKDIDCAVDKLSALIFGIDSLDFRS